MKKIRLGIFLSMLLISLVGVSVLTKAISNRTSIKATETSSSETVLSTSEEKLEPFDLKKELDSTTDTNLSNEEIETKKEEIEKEEIQESNETQESVQNQEIELKESTADTLLPEGFTEGTSADVLTGIDPNTTKEYTMGWINPTGNSSYMGAFVPNYQYDKRTWASNGKAFGAALIIEDKLSASPTYSSLTDTSFFNQATNVTYGKNITTNQLVVAFTYQEYQIQVIQTLNEELSETIEYVVKNQTESTKKIGINQVNALVMGGTSSLKYTPVNNFKNFFINYNADNRFVMILEDFKNWVAAPSGGSGTNSLNNFSPKDTSGEGWESGIKTPELTPLELDKEIMVASSGISIKTEGKPVKPGESVSFKQIFKLNVTAPELNLSDPIEFTMSNNNKKDVTITGNMISKETKKNTVYIKNNRTNKESKIGDYTSESIGGPVEFTYTIPKEEFLIGETDFSVYAKDSYGISGDSKQIKVTVSASLPDGFSEGTNGDVLTGIDPLTAKTYTIGWSNPTSQSSYVGAFVPNYQYDDRSWLVQKNAFGASLIIEDVLNAQPTYNSVSGTSFFNKATNVGYGKNEKTNQLVVSFLYQEYQIQVIQTLNEEFDETIEYVIQNQTGNSKKIGINQLNGMSVGSTSFGLKPIDEFKSFYIGANADNQFVMNPQDFTTWATGSLSTLTSNSLSLFTPKEISGKGWETGIQTPNTTPLTINKEVNLTASGTSLKTDSKQIASGESVTFKQKIRLNATPPEVALDNPTEFKMSNDKKIDVPINGYLVSKNNKKVELYIKNDRTKKVSKIGDYTSESTGSPVEFMYTISKDEFIVGETTFSVYAKDSYGISSESKQLKATVTVSLPDGFVEGDKGDIITGIDPITTKPYTMGWINPTSQSSYVGAFVPNYQYDDRSWLVQKNAFGASLIIDGVLNAQPTYNSVSGTSFFNKASNVVYGKNGKTNQLSVSFLYEGYQIHVIQTLNDEFGETIEYVVQNQTGNSKKIGINQLNGMSVGSTSLSMIPVHNFKSFYVDTNEENRFVMNPQDFTTWAAGSLYTLTSNSLSMFTPKEVSGKGWETGIQTPNTTPLTPDEGMKINSPGLSLKTESKTIASGETVSFKQKIRLNWKPSIVEITSASEATVTDEDVPFSGKIVDYNSHSFDLYYRVDETGEEYKVASYTDVPYGEKVKFDAIISRKHLPTGNQTVRIFARNGLGVRSSMETIKVQFSPDLAAVDDEGDNDGWEVMEKNEPVEFLSTQNKAERNYYMYFGSINTREENGEGRESSLNYDMSSTDNTHRPDIGSFQIVTKAKQPGVGAAGKNQQWMSYFFDAGNIYLSGGLSLMKAENLTDKSSSNVLADASSSGNANFKAVKLLKNVTNPGLRGYAYTKDKSGKIIGILRVTMKPIGKSGRVKSDIRYHSLTKKAYYGFTYGIHSDLAGNHTASSAISLGNLDGVYVGAEGAGVGQITPDGFPYRVYFFKDGYPMQPTEMRPKDEFFDSSSWSYWKYNFLEKGETVDPGAGNNYPSSHPFYSFKWDPISLAINERVDFRQDMAVTEETGAVNKPTVKLDQEELIVLEDNQTGAELTGIVSDVDSTDYVLYMRNEKTGEVTTLGDYKDLPLGEKTPFSVSIKKESLSLGTNEFSFYAVDNSDLTSFEQVGTIRVIQFDANPIVQQVPIGDAFDKNMSDLLENILGEDVTMTNLEKPDTSKMGFVWAVAEITDQFGHVKQIQIPVNVLDETTEISETDLIAIDSKNGRFSVKEVKEAEDLASVLAPQTQPIAWKMENGEPLEVTLISHTIEFKKGDYLVTYEAKRDDNSQKLEKNSAISLSGELKFNYVPKKIDFEDSEITSKIMYSHRRETDWSIDIDNSILTNWSLKAKASPFVSTKGKKLTDSLIYKNPTNQENLLNEQDQVITTGDSTNSNPILKWQKSQGILIKVNPGTVINDQYSGEITWTLEDTPTND